MGSRPTLMRTLLTAVLALAALSVHAQSLDPGDILNRMGDPWSEIKQAIPPADSGRVVGKAGELLWREPDDDVTTVLLSIREGVLSRVTVTASADGRGEFDGILAELRQQVGEPADDGFFTTDQLYRMGVPLQAPIELSLDPEAGVMVVRLAEQ